MYPNIMEIKGNTIFNLDDVLFEKFNKGIFKLSQGEYSLNNLRVKNS